MNTDYKVNFYFDEEGLDFKELIKEILREMVKEKIKSHSCI